jgi:pilus assembly protein CpaF
MSQDSQRRRFPAAIPNPVLSPAKSAAVPTLKPTGLIAGANALASQPASGIRPDDDATDPHLTVVPELASPPSIADPIPISRSTVLNARLPDLGPLDSFMRDPDVTEIMVNDVRNIVIEKNGKMQPTRFVFKTAEEITRLITRLLQGTGKMLTPDNPYLDFTLPDGSRVNVVAPPLTQNGPCITIRKFPVKRYQVPDLLQSGMFDQNMSFFLNACVAGRLNVLISGGTGSGKTTFLNALTGFIPRGDRLVVIEDTPELGVPHANSVSMQTKPAGTNSPGINTRELVANALRMRPDRIIVGECRRGEALDMLQAMNTGHAGSMTTLHANSCRDALARLETLCMLSGIEIPLLAIRRQMASAIDLIVQIQRFRSGKRRVVNITEVTGMEGDMITLQDLFVADEGGSFKGLGFVPTFLDRLREQGIEVPTSIFGG